MFLFKSFLYKFTLDISNHDLSDWQVEKSVLKSETLKLFLINNHVLFVFTFLSVQFKYSVQHCVFIKLWSVHVTCFHSPSHFLLSGYLLCTPNNSNSCYLKLFFELSGVDCTLFYGCNHTLIYYFSDMILFFCKKTNVDIQMIYC